MFKKIKAALKYIFDVMVAEIIIAFLWVVTKIRYRKTCVNADVVGKVKKSTLYLASHTSLLDGMLIGHILWYRCHLPIPLLIEEHYYNPAIHWFLSRIDAISIPDFSSGTFDWKEKKLEETVNQIVTRLNEGRSILLFPTGTMKQTAQERMDGCSLIYRLLKQANPNICLVRITGLWGSSFSGEWTGKCPELYMGWGKRIFQIIANGIFFMPKRKILIEFEPCNQLTSSQSVVEINHLLENWYNAAFPDGEPVEHTPYYFWQKESTPPVPQKKPKQFEAFSGENTSLEEEVLEDIAQILSLPRETLSRDTKLGSELGLDSLDLAQLALHFETKFDLRTVSFTELHRISDIIHWVEEKGSLMKSVLIKEFALPDAEHNPSHSFYCSDLWNFPLQAEEYEKLIETIKKGSAKISSDKVGLMLLNSVEATATLEALYRLKKIPVLINWLGGNSFLEEIHLNSPNLPLITNKDFLNTLNLINIDGLGAQLIRLNDMKQFRSFSGTIQAEKSEIPTEIFLQYFVIESNKMHLKTLYRHDLQSIIQKIKSLGLKQDERIAVIHPFTDPYEVAMNAAFLMLGYQVFFLSSYRIGSKELVDFLDKWKISYALCTENFLDRLKPHPQIEKISIQPLDLIMNNRELIQNSG